MRIPFFQQAGARGSLLTQDDLTVNAYPEKLPDGRIALRKRKGSARVNQPSGGAATPRGIAAFNGEIVSVFGGNVYRGTTLIGPADLGVDRITDKAFAASWTETAVTVGAAETGPITGSNAYRLEPTNATNGTVQSSITVAAGETIFFSIWMKDNEGHATDDEVVARVTIALSGGTAKTYGAKFQPNSVLGPGSYEIAASAANGECQIKEAYGGLWYQCMMKMTTGNNTGCVITIKPGVGKTLVDADSYTATQGNTFYNASLYRSETTGTSVFHFTDGGVSPKLLAFSDGDDGWLMGTDWVMWPNLESTWNNVPGPAFLDGYLVKMSSTGQIDHSEPLTSYDWPPENTSNAESWADDGVFLCRHNNYLLAIGQQSMEFFYNAANTDGSAFSRVDGAMQRIGAANSRVCATLRGTVAFLSYPSAIYLVAETKPQRISTPPVERMLKGIALTDAWAYGYEVDGHSFFTWVFPTANISLTYDTSTQTWHQVTDTAGNYVKLINAVDYLGDVYMQHITDGYVWKLAGAQDNAVNFTALARTAYGDLGKSGRKRIRAMTFNGDLAAGATLSVRYTDDDFATWSTARSVSVSPRCKSWNWGAFFRRAFEISYTGSAEMRLFDVEIEGG